MLPKRHKSGRADESVSPYRAGTINWTLKSLKVKELPDGSIALAFSALQNEDGTLYNPERAAKPKSTGREYESILVCYWDSFVPKERSTLFYTTLQKTPSGKYKLSEKLVNALQSTDIEFPGSPTDNFGRSGSLDLSDSGILFVTFDPVLDVSKVQALRLWHLSVSNFTNAPDRLIKIEVPGYNGNFSSPAFSSDGKLAAFLSTKNFKDETDYNHIFVLRTSADRVFEIAPLGSPTSPAWDISPSSIVWSRDGREIYVSGKQRAREKFWRLHATNPDEQPTTRPIPRELDPKAPGAVIGVSPLGKDPEDPRLLVNWSSYTDSGSFYILNLDNSEQKVTADVRANHLKLGLDPSQISEITFRGASYEIQAWIMHPSNFSPAESYPLMLMVHGGPKSSWSDRWTTIFNPGLWAEQGYVVVLPNPSAPSPHSTMLWLIYPQDGLRQLRTGFQRSRTRRLGREGVRRLGEVHGVHRNAHTVHRHQPRHRRRALLRWVHDELYSRPAAGEEIPDPDLPRRDLLHDLHARERRARQRARLVRRRPVVRLLPRSRAQSLGRLRSRTLHAQLDAADAHHP